MTTPHITFIGAGNMGSALISGLIANGYAADTLYAADPDPKKLAVLEQNFHIRVTTDNDTAIAAADVVIFAVKPQVIANIAKTLTASIQTKRPLIISIAAGVRTQSLQKWLGDDVPIVRCMPNTPALIGSGASALFANAYVSKHQHSTAESILRACGIIEWVSDESHLDIVTALSGSGPAYFFLFMELLQQAAVRLGLPAETAKLLTIETALGTARMALESADSLPVLRAKVTSPGGTTEKALHVLGEANLQDIFLRALTAAKARAEELANEVG